MKLKYSLFIQSKGVNIYLISRQSLQSREQERGSLNELHISIEISVIFSQVQILFVLLSSLLKYIKLSDIYIYIYICRFNNDERMRNLDFYLISKYFNTHILNPFEYKNSCVLCQ